MRMTTICDKCKSGDIEYLGQDTCYCNKCKEKTPTRDVCVQTPFERQQARIYATGNRWAIENWNATHY